MGTQRRWVRLVSEGGVIVASILLAFFVDAWWETRQDRALERQYLSRIIAEVDGHVETAFGVSRYQAWVRDEALYIHDLFAKGDFSQVDPLEALRRAYDATRSLMPDFSTDVYAELIATGGLRLVEDEAVRARIASHYESLKTPPQFEFASLEYRDIVRGVIPPRTKLVIRSCGQECAWEITAAEARELLEVLASTPGVLEGASHAVEQWDRGAGYLEQLSARSDETAQYLREYLGG